MHLQPRTNQVFPQLGTTRTRTLSPVGSPNSKEKASNPRFPLLLSHSQNDSSLPPSKKARLFQGEIRSRQTKLRTEGKDLRWNLYTNQLLRDPRKATLRMSLSLLWWSLSLKIGGTCLNFSGNQARQRYSRLITSHSIKVHFLHLSFLTPVSPMDHTPVHIGFFFSSFLFISQFFTLTSKFMPPYPWEAYSFSTWSAPYNFRWLHGNSVRTICLSVLSFIPPVRATRWFWIGKSRGFMTYNYYLCASRSSVIPYPFN